jgi:hypothetical protein
LDRYVSFRPSAGGQTWVRLLTYETAGHCPLAGATLQLSRELLHPGYTTTGEVTDYVQTIHEVLLFETQILGDTGAKTFRVWLSIPMPRFPAKAQG